MSRRTSRTSWSRSVPLPAHRSSHLHASNRHGRLQACSIAQRSSVLMPRQPWEWRVVACGAGAPASVWGPPQLLTSCCSLTIAQAASSVPTARLYSHASRRDSTPFLCPSRRCQPAGCSSSPKRATTGCQRASGTPCDRRSSPACSSPADHTVCAHRLGRCSTATRKAADSA